MYYEESKRYAIELIWEKSYNQGHVFFWKRN